jgi:hypothetical protein
VSGGKGKGNKADLQLRDLAEKKHGASTRLRSRDLMSDCSQILLAEYRELPRPKYETYLQPVTKGIGQLRLAVWDTESSHVLSFDIRVGLHTMYRS